MSLAVRLVSDVVVRAQIPVKHDDRGSAEERETSDARTDPKRVGVGSQVFGDDVGGRLASELGKVCNTPVEARASAFTHNGYGEGKLPDGAWKPCINTRTKMTP